MAFCSNCGKELSDTAQFCGNCGAKRTAKSSVNFQTKKPTKKFNKDSFVKLIPNNCMNYKNVCFKIFAVMMASILIADNLGWLASYLTLTLNSDLFHSLQFGRFGCQEIVASISFTMFLVLGLIFALTPIFKKIKHKLRQKKSSVVLICWVTLLLWEILFFITTKDLFANYVFYQNIIEATIHILFAIFSLLVLFKNCYNNPFPTILILLVYWANQISIFTIDAELMWHNLKKSSEYFNDINGGKTSFLAGTQCFGFLALVLFAFLIRYLLPNLVSKIIILIGYLPILVMDCIELFNDFGFKELFNMAFAGACIIFFAFAYGRVKCASCGANVTVKNKCTKCEFEQQIKEKINYKKRLRDFGIAVGSCVVISLSLLVSSGIYSAAEIDKNIDNWVEMIESASIDETQDAWDDFESKVRSIKVYALTDSFTNNLTDYKLIRDNISDLKDISLASKEYRRGYVSKECAEDLKYINKEDLSNYSFFEKYYNEYLSMQPHEEKIQVHSTLTNNNKTLKITIENNNLLPLQSCTVKYDFRLLYVTTASYSNTEYENGSEIYTVKDIDGKSTKVFEFDFDVDKYYDGYYSYLLTSLWSSSIDIINFE